MLSRETGAWSGGVWGSQQYPTDNPPQAPHVLLRRFDLSRGQTFFTTSLTMAGPDGVPSSKTVGSYWDRIKIPQYRAEDNVLDDLLEEPVTASPFWVDIARPPGVSIEPYAQPWRTVQRWMLRSGIRYQFIPLNRHDDTFAVAPNLHELPVQQKFEVDMVTFPDQLIVVGALRAVLAYELDQRGML